MLLDLESMDATAISKLANQDCLVIRVKDFIDREHALSLGDRILTAGYDAYINAPSIGRIGMAFYEAERDPTLLERYFAQAQSNIHELRQRCKPYASPLDVLRCSLDEIWPAGAQLETLYGKKMSVGLSRVVDENIRFLAHHDIFAKDAPDSFRAHSLSAQFACNVYLTMPEQGGHLQVWQNELGPEEFDALRQDSYGIEPDILGAPAVEIAPEPGDLLLFNSRKMHSVTPGIQGQRLSLSCFVGYRGQQHPLTFWS